MEITIIKTEHAHLPKIHEIELDIFPVPWSMQSFINELDNPNAYYFTAMMESGEIVGFGGMWHIINEGHIVNVAVKHEYRRLGAGRRIVSRLLELAAEKEMIGVTLEVRMNNTAAQRLYTSFGFQPEGIRKNYYPETKEDAIIMWKYF